ncbi:MAG: hypothetical protein ACR2Q4_14725 [Geminicoccaceae bacterium]
MTPEERDQEWIKYCGPEHEQYRCILMLTYQVAASQLPIKDRHLAVRSIIDLGVTKASEMPEWRDDFAEILYQAADMLCTPIKEESDG